MELAWLPIEEWLRLVDEAGFVDVEAYGWFDRRPYSGGEDVAFRARRPDRS